MSPRLLVAFAALAIAALPLAAQAHSAPPATTNVQARRGSPSELVSGTTFGTLLSQDNGQSWRWICEEAMGSMARINPLLVWTQNGHLLAGDFYGLGLSRDRGCSWTELATFQLIGVSDLQLHPTLASVVLATTSSYSAQTNSLNGVYESTDEGLSFHRTSLMREKTYFSGVRVAPSRPARVYASAWWFQPVEGWLYRSDDSGATFSEVYRSAVGVGPLTVQAVSPVDAEVVFATAEEGGTPPVYRLLRSANGGASFQEVLRLQNPPRGVELSADGSTVYAVDLSAVYRSLDSGLTFEKLPAPTENACGRVVGDSVYVCGSPFTERWSLARAQDLDAGWTPVLRFQDVKGPIACPEGTAVATQCTPFWPALQERLATYGTAPTDGGTESPDAGTTEPRRGCGCGETPGSAPVLLLLALCAAALLAKKQPVRTDSFSAPAPPKGGPRPQEQLPVSIFLRAKRVIRAQRGDGVS